VSKPINHHTGPVDGMLEERFLSLSHSLARSAINVWSLDHAAR
jgi:hypothetical protein